MDTRTGEIEHLEKNQQPNEHQVELSEYEKRCLEGVPTAMRPFELAWLRTWKKAKWNGMDKIKRKEAFRQGWNSAVYMGANYFILNDKEKAAVENDEK